MKNLLKGIVGNTRAVYDIMYISTEGYAVFAEYAKFYFGRGGGRLSIIPTAFWEVHIRIMLASPVNMCENTS